MASDQAVSAADINYVGIAASQAPFMVILAIVICAVLLLKGSLARFLSEQTLKFNLLVLVTGSIGTATFIGVLTEYYMAGLGKKVAAMVHYDIPLVKYISEAATAQMQQSNWFERSALYALQQNEERLKYAESKALDYDEEAEKKLDIAMVLAKKGVRRATSAADVEEFKYVARQLEQIHASHKEFTSHMRELFDSLNQGHPLGAQALYKLEEEEDVLNEVTKKLLLQIEEYTLQAGINSLYLEKKSEFMIVLLNIFGLLLLLINASIILRVISNKLSGIEVALNHNYEKLNTLSTDLSSRSKTLSDISERQVVSLSHSVEGIGQINENIQSNLDQAKQSEVISQEVSEAAAASHRSMQELLSNIHEITKSNEEISNLTSLIKQIEKRTNAIDDIVFKTTILSFNTSVEAERAGEHGRGFAVVAQEVNNLALLSGKAALEISNFVKDSIEAAEKITKSNGEKVLRSQERGKDTAQSFSEVLGAAEKLLAQSKQIATSSNDQARGMKQINGEISQVREDVVSSSEEASSLAQICTEVEKETESIGRSIGNVQHMLNS
ncbi:MAG: methyl-accepting chemotaxis protein [Zetaproteobacteria bacterium]|nr:methyl-accepting chemotaxis protein [Zetaproteobacteria bacterium]